MNRFQLIIAWITGIIICLVCFHPPTYEYHEQQRIDLVKTILYIVPILILGVLLILTLRNEALFKPIMAGFFRIKGFWTVHSKKILRVVIREVIIFVVIISVGIGVGFSSRFFSHKHYIYEDAESVLSSNEFEDMYSYLNKVVAYCGEHPEIKIYGFHTGNPKIDGIVEGDTVSILEIAEKMAKENPSNKIVYDKLEAISDKLGKNHKFDFLSAQTVTEQTSKEQTPHKKSFLSKIRHNVLSFIRHTFTEDNIEVFGVFIILFGYPVYLGIRFIVWAKRRLFSKNKQTG